MSSVHRKAVVRDAPSTSARDAAPTDGARVARDVVLSLERVDDMGDIVRVDGIDLTRYRKNPVVLLQHGRGPEFPVVGGHASISVGRSAGIKALLCDRFTFADTRLAREIAGMWAEGILRATSIGFKVLGKDWFRPIDRDGNPAPGAEPPPGGGWEFLRSKLYEFSIVALPANEDALRKALETAEAARAYFDLGVARGSEVPDGSPAGAVVKECAGLHCPGCDEYAGDVEADECPGTAAGMHCEGCAGYAAEGQGVVEKPLPNEHACRLRDPADFKPGSFRRTTREHDGREYAVIAGRLRGQGTMTDQAYRYPTDGWTSAQARTHCSDHDGSFEPASSEADAEPLRWNRTLGKEFDVDAQHYEPATAEYALVAGFLECRVCDIYAIETPVPSYRMGSFLSAVRGVLAVRGYQLRGRRNLTYDGREAPPVWQLIQLTSARSESFVVDGAEFYRTDVGIVVRTEPRWWGLSVRFYANVGDSDTLGTLVGEVWDGTTGTYNCLRGEAFSLSGEFIPRSEETLGDVFLEPTNEDCLAKVVHTLNERGAQAPPRGVLMMGPPGCGKTLSGRVMRNEAKATFVWVTSRDFYYAGTFGGLATAFDLARELAPSVLFFEDIDNWLADTSIDLLKTELDGVRQARGLVTVLTTNSPERLPDALVDRPGRFHDVLKFDLPSAEVRERMLRAWLPGLSSDVLGEMVAETAGYSGAYVRELAVFAQTTAEQDGLDLDPAVRAALEKLRAQRELVRLRASPYQPPPAVAGAMIRPAWSVSAVGSRHLTVVAPQRGAPSGPPECERDVSAAARLLKATSLEPCPECRALVPYVRQADRFVAHRRHPSEGGEVCRGQRLGIAPTGPTLKEVLDGARDGARCGQVDKEGRVLSAANERTLREAVENIEEALRAITVVLDAAKRPEVEEQLDGGDLAVPADGEDPDPLREVAALLGDEKVVAALAALAQRATRVLAEGSTA